MPQFLQQQKKKQDEELSALRKEVTALQIMKNNYDQIVKANQARPGQSENQVPDEIKFHLVCRIKISLLDLLTVHLFVMQFQTIMENLFQTFDSTVSVANFMELSSCAFAWVEEHCKPQVSCAKISFFQEHVIGICFLVQILRNLVTSVLQQLIGRSN